MTNTTAATLQLGDTVTTPKGSGVVAAFTTADGFILIRSGGALEEFPVKQIDGTCPVCGERLEGSAGRCIG